VLTVLLSSPRVAPGLLTWQAWSALRAADRVLAGSGGHPLIPALTAAEVVPVVVDAPPSTDAAALAAFLSSATLSADVGSSAEGASAGGARQVVWLAAPGEPPDPVFLSQLAVPHQVLHGSHDLPGVCESVDRALARAPASVKPSRAGR